MSDDTALGFFDADGSILMSPYYNTNGTPSLGFKVTYFLGQSSSKQDAVTKFADKFGSKVLVTNTAVEFRYNQSSEEGQRFRQFLLKNKPKHPSRLRDFYVSEEIINLLSQKTQQSRVGQITLAFLAANKSRLDNKEEERELTFSACCVHINATAAEIKEGSNTATDMLSKIEVKLKAYEQTLSATKLSDDYALGVHFGDGCLYVALSWKPTPASHRLRCDPEWAISGNREDFCQAFVNTYGGLTKRVDAKGQRKYVLSGIDKSFNMIYLFDNAPWMPEYKKEQFSRWKESILLLKAKKHFTEEGIRKLLDLSYDLAEKGARQYEKEQYLEWGLAWLNRSGRMRRGSQSQT